jgi:hypothetical protein
VRGALRAGLGARDATDLAAIIMLSSFAASVEGVRG